MTLDTAFQDSLARPDRDDGPNSLRGVPLQAASRSQGECSATAGVSVITRLVSISGFRRGCRHLFDRTRTNCVGLFCLDTP